MATQVTQPVEPQAPERGVDPKDGVEKFIYSYQPRDREGQFIGKPYKYFYIDHADLAEQIRAGKEEGDRYIHEVKTGKRQVHGEPASPRTEFIPAPESTEETDRKRREDFRKTAQEEFGAPPEVVRETLKKASKFEEGMAAQNWALNKEAEGYYMCAQNGRALIAWLDDETKHGGKKLAYTPANYDLAFEALKDTLVPKPSEQPVAPADSTQQPAPPPTQAKPQSTGIIPGQFAGTRQPNSTEKRPLTAERFRQIKRMSRDEWNRLRRANPKEADAYLQMTMPAQPQQ
jgi:hypothetical protein